MNSRGLTLAGISLLLILAGLISAPAAYAQSMKEAMPQGTISSSQLQFHKTMDKLWDDHVAWTRLYIISALNNLADKDATAQRLLQNQTDIGNAIKPYYGNAAGDKLTGLLKDHIMIAAEIVGDVKAGDNAKMMDASKRWYTNADEIATFLSGANPQYWPLAEMTKMMHDHLDLTTQELTATLKGDYAASISAYDKVHTEILQMSDMLANGIIDQNSVRF